MISLLLNQYIQLLQIAALWSLFIYSIAHIQYLYGKNKTILAIFIIAITALILGLQPVKYQLITELLTWSAICIMSICLTIGINKYNKVVKEQKYLNTKHNWEQKYIYLDNATDATPYCICSKCSKEINSWLKQVVLLYGKEKCKGGKQ